VKNSESWSYIFVLGTQIPSHSDFFFYESFALNTIALKNVQLFFKKPRQSLHKNSSRRRPELFELYGATGAFDEAWGQIERRRLVAQDTANFAAYLVTLNAANAQV